MSGDLPRSVRLTPLDGRGRLQPKSFLGERPPRAPLVAEGLMHPHSTTVIYGHGGVGKGWVAAYAFRALQAEGHNPVIFDMEGVEWEWDERLTGMGCVVLDAYLSIPAPLTVAYAIEVAELAQEYGWTHGILDSASVAKGKTRDADSGGQDAAVALFQNIQLFGIPTLLLAHEAKKGEGPIGSVQYTAQARLVWHATAPTSLTTELRMTKVNDRPLESKSLTFTRHVLPGGVVDIVRDLGAIRKPADAEKESASAAILRLMRERDRSLDAMEIQRFLSDLGYEVPLTSLRVILSRFVRDGKLIRPQVGRYAWPVPQDGIT